MTPEGITAGVEDWITTDDDPSDFVDQDIKDLAALLYTVEGEAFHDGYQAGVRSVGEPKTQLVATSIYEGREGTCHVPPGDTYIAEDGTRIKLRT